MHTRGACKVDIPIYPEMKKRYRTPKAKPGELLVKFGQKHGERDLFYCWPENDCGMNRDSKFLSYAFERIDIIDGNSLRQELEDRGYDITTLKFSIQKKQNDDTNIPRDDSCSRQTDHRRAKPPIEDARAGI